MTGRDLSRAATTARVRAACCDVNGLSPFEIANHVDYIVNVVMDARRAPRNPYAASVAGLARLNVPHTTGG